MIQRPKGTKDIFENIGDWQRLETIIKSVCDFYNYIEIRTPIFESADLFKRAVGTETDAVNKEMYEFLDKGNRSMALRPENTAGVVRAYVQEKMYAVNKLTKLYYIGPQFRYERPQGGRQRQFYQFGVEALGVKSPHLDVEQIVLAYTILSTLGLKKIKILINTLGDTESRERYKRILTEYFRNNRSELCEDCRKRVDTNVLRVLDCKIDKNNSVLKNAPKLSEYLNEESKAYFDEVKKLLEIVGIDFVVDEKLVRGLDYYSDTVFEIVSTVSENSQSTICGGGRYDSLIGQLGGPSESGVGFAMGMERLLIACDDEDVKLSDDRSIDVFIVTIGEKAKNMAILISSMLRSSGFVTELDFNNSSFKAQFKAVERTGAKIALIIGDNEVSSGCVNLKIQQTNEELTVSVDDLIKRLDNILL